MSLRPVVEFQFSPDHADIVKYRVYVRTAAEAYGPRFIDIPTPTPSYYRMQSSEVTPWVTNFISMTCFNTAGIESPLSNEASVLVTGGLLIK